MDLQTIRNFVHIRVDKVEIIVEGGEKVLTCNVKCYS